MGNGLLRARPYLFAAGACHSAAQLLARECEDAGAHARVWGPGLGLGPVAPRPSSAIPTIVRAAAAAPVRCAIWLTASAQIPQVEALAARAFAGQPGPVRLAVLLRLSPAERQSLRVLYGALHAVYQRCTAAALCVGPAFLAALDVGVFFDWLGNVAAVIASCGVVYWVGAEGGVPAPECLRACHQVVLLPADAEARMFVPASPLLDAMPDAVGSCGAVAVGGTFDHLHSGHKLMLSLAALLGHGHGQGALLCGVTAGDAMLARKSHRARLQPLAVRMARVRDFLRLFGAPRAVLVPLRDPFGPAASDRALQALVVSPETLPGGLSRTLLPSIPHALTAVVNATRVAAGLPALRIIQVDLIMAHDATKLSSTFVRSHLE